MVVADLMVFMTVRFVDAALDSVFETVFFMTVPVLASLDSLDWLIFLRPRPVAVVDVDDVDAEAAAGFLPRVDVLAAAVADAAPFRAAAAPRVAFAFSTMVDNRFEDALPLMGDAGRAIWDLAGDTGRSWARGATRAFVEAGDRTWPA